MARFIAVSIRIQDKISGLQTQDTRSMEKTNEAYIGPVSSTGSRKFRELYEKIVTPPIVIRNNNQMQT